MFPSLRSIICYTLSSIDITLLHWYYDVIRLLSNHLDTYPYRSFLHTLMRALSPPKLTCYNSIYHAVPKNSGKAIFFSRSEDMMLTSDFRKSSSFPSNRDFGANSVLAIMVYGLIDCLPTLNALGHPNTPKAN